MFNTNLVSRAIGAAAIDRGLDYPNTFWHNPVDVWYVYQIIPDYAWVETDILFRQVLYPQYGYKVGATNV